MSLRMLTAVWESSKHAGGRLLLMLAIADNANDLGYAWPGESTLARKTRMSKRQVHRLIHELADEHDELAVAWGGMGARSTNRYYILVGKKEDEIQTILRHVSEWNGKRQTKTLPFPLDESRAGEDSEAQPKHPCDDQESKSIGDKMSPIHKGDIHGALVTSAPPIGDICDNKGDIAMSPKPINRINHQQQNRVMIARVTISLFPSPHLHQCNVDGDDGFLVALLDDLDIRGKKRREIERLKPKPEFVLAHALYAAARGKAAGWVIVETLAQSIPPSDFITFARLGHDEWLALWRGSAHGEWSLLPPALYQMRGQWMQAFDSVFKQEPFIQVTLPEARVIETEQPALPMRQVDPKPTEHELLWKDALEYLKIQLTTATFQTWLGRSAVVNEQCNGKLVIALNRTGGEMVNRLRPMIVKSVERVAGYPVEIELI